MKGLKEVKAIHIINIALIIVVATCAIILFRMNATMHTNSKIPEAEIKVSKRYDSVSATDNKTQSEYVTFDAFFLKDLDGDGRADAIRGTCNEVGKSDILYFELRVLENGYLKDGVITIDSKNFYLGTTIVKDEIVGENYLSNNTKEVVLNDVYNGSQKIFMGIVRSGDYSSGETTTSAIGNDTNNYSKVNSIKLTGTHVAEDGTETPIDKEVLYNVDWYGTTTAKIVYPRDTLRNIAYTDTSMNFSFTMETTELENELILQDSVLTGKVPALNGFMPSSVRIKGPNVTYKYNKETGEFEARRDASKNSNGVVTSNAEISQIGKSRYNSYTINVSYPIEADETMERSVFALKIPMQTYYEGYNNPNEEFDNPYKSNVAESTVITYWLPRGGAGETGIDVQIGRYLGNPYYKYYISKEKPLKLYNNISEEETEDYYTVRWYVHTGSNYSKITLKENENNSYENIDTFIKTDASEESTKDVVSNVGIYFSNLDLFLGANGWLKVYNDETNDLLATFDSSNWNMYDSKNPYMYNKPVKHIRVETSQSNKSAGMNIYSIKEINDANIKSKYNAEQFDALQYIKSYLKVYFGDSIKPSSDFAIACYEARFSTAMLELAQNQISTQETWENEIMTIKVSASNFMEHKWKNGSFLLKMPPHIIDMSVNSVSIDNYSVQIKDTNLYEENGNYYLRIETQNEEPTAFTITVDCNLTADPRTFTTTENIEMYAKNEEAAQYYFMGEDEHDVDANGNTIEKVHKSETELTLASPTALMSYQEAKNYDNKGSVTVTPQVAKVDKSQRTADTEITLQNNYTSKITNILVQGVIPFEGNEYVSGNRKLGSEFTTTMSSTGISFDDPELLNYATVYYSTAEKPTKDINDSTNGWVTAENVSDWSQIKTFLIDLGNYELEQGEKRTFKYELNIPEGLDYNDVSYSEHGVYFDIETNGGLYSTSTSVSKLGFMIARQYDLVIEKYQENTNKKLPGTAFNIIEVGNENEAVKKITDKNGQIIASGLYAERKYKIKEIKISEDYVLNNEEIEFYTYVDENDNLVVKYYDEGKNKYEDLDKKYDWIKSAEAVKEEDKDYQVRIALENEVKAKLKITKTNGKGEELKGVKFLLTGEGKNTTLITDESGIASVSGLYIGKTYTLTETKATGYYLIENPITISISRTQSGFSLKANGEIVSSSITTEDEIPIINLSIDDEEIPKYSLKVTKYEEHKDEVEDKKLPGAQFRLTGDGLPSNGVLLTTDENGEINLSGLYEYVQVGNAAKGGITGEYTLVETYAPEGFALDATPIVFKAYRDNGELKVQIISGENRISTIQPATVTNASSETPTLEFAVEDPPIFTLKKFDEEGKPLAGAKFAIYTLDNDLKTTGFAKDLAGNFIGDYNESEKIYTITIPANGEISLNLPQGLYKAVEVEAPQGFALSANEEDRTEHFGIGASKPEELELKLVWKKPVKGEGFNTINSSYATSDGGVIAVGSVYGTAALDEDGTTYITSEGRKDGLVIKYDVNGNIEWTKNIGGTLGEEFKKVIQTKDGGYAVVGYFESETMNVDANITNSGARDAILMKLNSSGEYEWSAVIGGALEDYAYSLCEDNNRNIIITGGYFSQTLGISGTDTTIANSQDMFGYVASFSSTGSFNWVQNLENNVATSGVQAVDVAVVSDSYAVAVNFWGTLTASGNSIANIAGNVTNQDSALIFYSANGEYQKYINISGAGNDDIRGVTVSNDGNLVVYGNRTNSTTTLSDSNGAVTIDATGNVGYLSAYVFKLDSDGKYLADKSFTFGTASNCNDEIMEVVPTDDNGLLIAGFTYSQALDFDGDGTNDIISTGDTNENFSRGFVAKLDENNKVTSAYRQYLAGYYQETRTVAGLADGGIVAGGVADGIKLSIDPTGEELTGLDAYSGDGFVVSYNNVVTVPEIAEKSEITFNNKLQRFTVTTTIYSTENLTEEEINREKQDEDWKYGNKTVITGKYGSDKLLYDTGAAVTGDYGKYNEVDYEEANHVKYVETIKYDDNGQKEIVITPEEDYSIVGIIINGEEHKYSVSETDGSVTIPVFENVKEDKHIVVIVDKNMAGIRVNHYLWTEENGPTTTSVAGSESRFRKVGESYDTVPRTDIEYDIITNGDYYSGKEESQILAELGKSTWKELGKDNFDDFKADYYIPSNAKGKYKTETQIINYYYKEKDYKLTVRHLIAGSETPVPNKDTGEGVEDEITDNLKSGTPYTTTKSDKVDYSIYEVVAVSTTDEKGVVNEENFDSTGTITDNTTVTYYYQIKDGTDIIVHHYIVGTTTQVPSKTGEPVGDEIINTVIENEQERQAKVGDSYTTHSADNLAVNYRIAKNEEVFAGKTEAEVLATLGVSSWNDTSYNSYEEFLAADYIPGNSTGRFTAASQEVIYYYILEIPTVTNIVEKTVDKPSLKETDADQSLTYTIKYNAAIKDYKGDASITLTDTLPFEIDTSKPYSLNGGTYNAETKTITWKQLFKVDTFENKATGAIEITKTITLTYKDVPPLTNTLVNKVEGSAKLIDVDITSDIVKDKAETTYKQDRNITVTKVWSDNNDSLAIRPQSVTVNLIGKVENANVDLKALDSSIATSVTLSNNAASEQNWKYTWNSLPKYNTEGKEIEYSVEEAPFTGNLAVVYSTAVTGDMASGYTITNTYTKPTEKIQFVVNKVWDDNNNENGKRPAQIKFEVYNKVDNIKVAEYTLNTENETSHTFELDKYDAKGNALSYIAKEVEIKTGDLKYYDAPVITNGTTENEVIITNKFKTLNTTETSKITKTGTSAIYKSNDKVNYRINYKATVKEYLGNATLEIVDTLPYSIDEAQSDLKGGVYSATNNTITWNYDLGEIDTIVNGDYEVEKNIIIDVVFTNIDLTKNNMVNNVKGKLTLKNKTDEVEDDHTTNIEVFSGVVVHHYIENTIIQLAPDDKIQNQKVGTDYTTNKSPDVPKNYEVVSVVTKDDKATVNEATLKTEGKVREELIEVIYYYNLKQETVTNDIAKTAEIIDGSQKSSVLTQEDGEVTYTITYIYSIKDYIGKAKITLVDTLPAKINLEKSNLAGGTYNAETNTITWEEKIANINTYDFENGICRNSIEKQLTIVYDGQDVNADLENTVKGTIVTYYPDEHPVNPGEVKTILDDEDKAVVKQEYKVAKTVQKVWDDNNNERGNRPEKLEAELTANGTKVESVILSDSCHWRHIFTNLNKYDAEGKVIEYKISEKEIEKDDLEYYEEPVVSVEDDKTTITNIHRKLSNKIESTIDKDGTKELVGRENKVEYSIKYNAKISEYIGDARVTVIDKLPCKIDVNNSDIAEAIYDEEAQTLTWTQELGHINTVRNGDFTVSVNKEIKLSYVDLDVEAERITNRAKGILELIPTGEKDEVEDPHDTVTNLQGKIIVQYKDIDTDEDIPYIDKNGEEKLYNYDEKGYIDDDYKTGPKDIPYYELVKVPENKDGKYKKEDQTITYYYRKLLFNIGIEKTVKEITANGEAKNIPNKKLAKLEIPESKLSTTEVLVKYKIVVKNTEKVEGKAEIIDTIPAGFELASTNPTYWTQLQGGKIQTNVELKVGQQKELEVVLKWKNSSQNLGTTKNIVEITNTDNPPKYQDNNPNDNVSEAEVILTVKTGIEVLSDILLITGTIGLAILFVVIIVDMKKKRM